MKHYKIGYTQGVYDMFHIGHLNLLNNAKNYCDFLIVGVNSDTLVQEYKHKRPVVSEIDRKTIVENIKVQNKVVILTLRSFSLSILLNFPNKDICQYLPISYL
jgi:glycerol-3-phosphate cytidylyltransferase